MSSPAHESHAFHSSDGIYCDTCNLPAKNARHLQWNLVNTTRLLVAKEREYRNARDDYFALALLHTKIAARIEYPDAQVVGINVTQGYEHPHTYTSITVEGIYAADGRALADTDDDLDGLLEYVAELAEQHFDLEPDEHKTYKLDLDAAEIIG